MNSFIKTLMKIKLLIEFRNNNRDPACRSRMASARMRVTFLAGRHSPFWQLAPRQPYFTCFHGSISVVTHSQFQHFSLDPRWLSIVEHPDPTSSRRKEPPWLTVTMGVCPL